MIGDPCVGKTSLINVYYDMGFLHSYSPTIGIDFVSKKLNIPYEGKQYMINT